MARSRSLNGRHRTATLKDDIVAAIVHTVARYLSSKIGHRVFIWRIFPALNNNISTDVGHSPMYCYPTWIMSCDSYIRVVWKHCIRSINSIFGGDSRRLGFCANVTILCRSGWCDHLCQGRDSRLFRASISNQISSISTGIMMSSITIVWILSAGHPKKMNNSSLRKKQILHFKLCKCKVLYYMNRL